MSNGKSSIPCIRLTGDVPLVGAPLSAIGVYAEDEQYATLEHAAEWFKDEIDYTTAVPDDTVMEAGSVYYAFVKLNTTDDFYFTEDTTVRMLNSDAADLTDRYGVNSHLEAYFKFTPRTPAKTQITLGTLSDGGTYGDALSGFGAVSDGKPLSFLVALYRDGAYEGGVGYDCAADSWWIASGDLSEFLSRPIAPDAAYRFVVTLFEKDTVFTSDSVTVSNPKAADRLDISAEDQVLTLTASYRIPEGDFNADGAVDTTDVSELLISVLFGKGGEHDVNGDGTTDALDALALMKDGLFTDAEQTPELFIAAAYDSAGSLCELRVINLSEPLSDADFAFLQSAASISFFYLSGDSAPVAEAFSYHP
ncbi:MAG: hypothetical protein K6G54_06940 [Oscillospiraceae bacterium]|nr:hypothetical protein [Oscillospiraceae bacterium]